ncbi:cold-shock protein [Actinomycetaceae bacterium MB13-C1-2]|nr:cold-shock protein [Actinomycetaceae bacterium MB13-C1-2]
MADTMTGVVKWFNSQKGFGFITPDDGSADVFAHYSNIEGSGIRNLYEEQKVQFRVENSPKGLSAVEIVAID